MGGGVNWGEDRTDGIQALLKVVGSGAKNMEICVVGLGGNVIMEEKDVDAIVKEIEAGADVGKTNPWYHCFCFWLHEAKTLFD